MTLDDFFAAHQESRQIFDILRKAIDRMGNVEIRVTRCSAGSEERGMLQNSTERDVPGNSKGHQREGSPPILGEV